MRVVVKMDALQNLKEIIKHKPDGATHIATSVGKIRYLKHNVRRDFVYYDGRTFCSFPSRSWYLRTCESIRELSDIERIIELMEENKYLQHKAGYVVKQPSYIDNYDLGA